MVGLMGWAAESESRPELESVGVDHFNWSRSRSWSWQNLADSDSGPESKANTRQQTITLDERFHKPPEFIEGQEEKESGSE